MNNHNDSLKFRLERIKCLSNLQLKLLQYVHGVPYGDSCTFLSTAELYARKEAIIHVHGLVGDFPFCVTLGLLDRNGHYCKRTGCCELPVFIRIGHVSEGACPITSFVRLQPLNICNMIGGESGNITFMSTGETIFAILDRKLRAVYDFFGIETCQLINEIIQGGSQIIDNFAYKYGENIGDGFCTHGHLPNTKADPLSIFREGQFWIFINGNIITHFLAEGANPTIQIRQVFACPINPFISAIELMHDMLYSTYGRQENGQTKDSSRVRDTHPKEKGRVRRTRKGDETDQALSSPPPPEEVKSRTAPYHHHGGYTAKHTHSGSLEDV